ncbi:hypothetical protein AL546_011005 [Vibrio vulnificus]|nr:hypothetical protein AL546_011005 [Vibrio vulnificus]
MRWRKCLQRQTSTNAETASPIIVILANAGIHLPARTEQCVGESTYSGKHSKCRESKVNAVVPSTHNARFRMDPRLREDDKQKTNWDGVEYFCLQKAATRQTRTALKFVSIIEPHPHRRHSRERGNPFTRAHRAVRWRKCLQRKTFQMQREQGECCRTINSQCTL